MSQANPTQVNVQSTGDLTKTIDIIERSIDEHRSALAEVKAERERLAADHTARAEEHAALKQEIADHKAEIAELKKFRAQADLMEADQPHTRERYYTGVAGSREAAINRAYDLFGRAVVDIAALQFGRTPPNGIIKTREQTLSGTGEGADTIPLPILQQISVLQEKFGFARRNLQTIQMTSDSMGANAFGSDATISYPDENDTPADTNVLLRNPRPLLQAKLAVVNIKVSLQMDMNAPATLQRFWIDRIFTKQGLEEDRVLFVSNNNPSPWKGVLVDANVPEKVIATQSFEGIIAKEVVQTIHKVSQHVRGQSKLVFSEDVFGILQGLEDTSGRPLWSPMGSAAAPVIYGHQYETHPGMPTLDDDGADEPMFAVAAWREAGIFGDRMATAVDFDRSVHFTSAAIAMRMLSYFGILLIQPTACARARTAP